MLYCVLVLVVVVLMVVFGLVWLGLIVSWGLVVIFMGSRMSVQPVRHSPKCRVFYEPP